MMKLLKVFAVAFLAGSMLAPVRKLSRLFLISIISVVLVGCYSAKSFRYDSTENICAMLTVKPSYNLKTKGREEALALRGETCDDANQAEIARHVREYKEERKQEEKEAREARRERKLFRPRIRCTTIGHITTCRER